LPEIPDYERPELETYEKTDFDPEKAKKVSFSLILLMLIMSKLYQEYCFFILFWTRIYNINK
jgi:hypothetical protein